MPTIIYVLFVIIFEIFATRSLQLINYLKTVVYSRTLGTPTLDPHH